MACEGGFWTQLCPMSLLEAAFPSSLKASGTLKWPLLDSQWSIILEVVPQPLQEVSEQTESNSVFIFSI